MFTTSKMQIDSYNKVGLETGVDGANSYRLITMLLDGAILSLGRSAQALKELSLIHISEPTRPY